MSNEITPPSERKILGSFTLAMIAVVAVIDLRSSAMMATFGFSAGFYFLMTALLYFIPFGFVCAELSTTVHEQGGMYAWIRAAFGGKMGFIAIWFEWINNIIAFPASLSFIAVTLTYLIDPALGKHKFLILIMTLCALWGVTIFTLRGIKASSRMNKLGAVFGTILPALIIAALGAVWIATGKPQQIVLNWKNLLPDWRHSNPGFYATMILGFGGLQIIAFHTSNAINPRRDYPRAILLAAAIVFSICLFTTLAIATVIPHNDLNLISGFIDSFSWFFTAFGMPWATPLIIFLVVFGTLSTFNAWYLGPARGMAVAAHNGFIPKVFSRLNKHDVPANILLLQGLLCTFFSLIFLYMPDISSGFWILLNLSSQTALLVYIFIFLSALKLRYLNAGKVTSGYRIPGGKLGIWLASGTGVVACSIALVLSVIPPTMVKTGSLWSYESILLLSNLVFFGIPVLILILEKKFNQKK
jgi:glutamate:GABA antiporter